MLHLDSTLIVIERERLSPACAAEKSALACIFTLGCVQHSQTHCRQREWNCLSVIFDFPTSFLANSVPPSSEVVNCLLRGKEWTNCSSIICGLSGFFRWHSSRSLQSCVDYLSWLVWSVLICIRNSYCNGMEIGEWAVTALKVAVAKDGLVGKQICFAVL